MYLDFFGFGEKPFYITPNPRFLFLSRNHKEAFAHLLYGIQQQSGFVELTGEVGTGKTTVLRTLLEQLEESDYRLALVFNPCVSAIELLQAICREFGVNCEGENLSALHAALNGFLLEERRRGRTVVLVIDEAQNLAPEVLEQVRLLSNLETHTEKLIQIVLVGQPELGRLLDRPELRQLSQRCGVRYHLGAMDYRDSCAYIAHRLRVAGWKGGPLFSRWALRGIYHRSGGLPRLINILCDRSLVVAFGEEQRRVSLSMVRQASRELARGGPGRRRRVAPALSATLLMIALIALAPHLPLPDVPHPGGSASLPPAESSVSLPSPGEGEGQAPGLGEASLHGLARRWQVGRLPTGGMPTAEEEIQRLSAAEGVRVSRFRGSFAEALKLNTPLLFSTTLPGQKEYRSVALLAIRGQQAEVAAGTDRPGWIKLKELAERWPGEASFWWRNFDALPVLPLADSSGAGILRLQALLRQAGFPDLAFSGRYDRQTVAAVRTFQQARGIAADGQVGPQTLVLLYQEAGRDVPRLRSGVRL